MSKQIQIGAGKGALINGKQTVNEQLARQQARFRLVEDRRIAGEKMSIRSATIGDLKYLAESGERFAPEEVDRVIKHESERYIDTYVNDKFPYIAAGGEGKHLYLIPKDGPQKGVVLKVFDAFNFYGVTSAVGHSSEEIREIALRQMEKGALTSGNLNSPSRSALCEYLFDNDHGLFTELLPKYHIYMLNSGSESNDAALKLAVEYHRDITRKLKEKDTIIAMHHGFHGRTGYAIQLNDADCVIKDLPKIDMNVKFVNFGDSAGLERAFDENKGRILSVHFEPVQGEPGVNVAPAGFLPKMRELSDREDAVMVADEVQTFARTGDWFASIGLGGRPDIIITGKIISGGNSPATVIYARGEITFGVHRHGNTYTGNPLACELVMRTLYIIERDGLLENSKEVGAYLLEQLKERLEGHPLVKNVRGRGAMVGIELADSVKDKGFYYANNVLEEGVLLTVAGGVGRSNEVLRMLLPLSITKKEVDVIVNAVERALG